MGTGGLEMFFQSAIFGSILRQASLHKIAVAAPLRSSKNGNQYSSFTHPLEKSLESL